MQVTEKSNEGLKRDYQIVVAAADIDSKVQERLSEVGQQARIPGFRPGKIPMTILKQRFGSSVTAEVLEGTVRDTSAKLLEERGLRPAGQPKIEITSFDDGKDLEYDMSVELLPDITLMDLSKLELVRLKAEVTDKDLDEALGRLATAHKVYEPVAKKRAAKSGELAVIDFEGRLDGETFDGGTAADFELELGSNSLIPGFEDQVIGQKAGDKFDVNVTFPEDYNVEKLAGKDVVFACEFKELRERIETKVDDELAKAAGLEGLDALKDAVREQMGREYGQASRGKLKRDLLDRLEAAHEFEAPESMLDAEFDSIWAQIEEAKKKDQLDPEDAAKDEEELKTQYREIAGRRVRLGLILSAVGEGNDITVSQEELNRAMMEEARKYPGEEQKVIDFFRSNPQARASLQAPVFEDKVVDFIVEMAQVSETEVTSEDLLKPIDEEGETEAAEPKKTAKKKASKPKAKKSSS